MAYKVINEEKEIIEGKVVITKTFEETLTGEDLKVLEKKLEQEKKQLIKKSKDLKKAFDDLVERQDEIKDLLKQLPEDEFINLE